MCDTLVSLTTDGILFAKNSDRDPNEAQVIRWHPAADHPIGSSVRCTWTSIPQATHTHAVALSQPWWMWGAEMGANEHGVVMGNEAVFTDAAKGEPALLGMDLLRLGLERSTSATDAVSVVVALLERHGQGGPCSHDHPRFSYDNSFIVADRDEAFVLETSGREWATERVTGSGRSISNGLTIEPFARIHADRLRGRVAACAIRQARTQRSAEGAESVADLFTALRDHGPDPSPTYARTNGALDAPCAHAGGLLTATQTTGSWVADLRGDPRHWVTGTAAPCTSTFAPLLVDEAAPCDGDEHASQWFDPAVAWWRHEVVHRIALADHAAAIARFGPARDRLEHRWLADPPTRRDALAEVQELDRAWLDDLTAAHLPDRRPAWLRRLWERWDDDANLRLPHPTGSPA